MRFRGEAMWSGLYRTAIRAPRTTLLVAVAILAALAPGLLRLKMRTDGMTLVPPGAPEVEADAEIRELFGLGDQIVVVLETDDPAGIYNGETLRRLQRLSEGIEALDAFGEGIGSERIESLANEGSDRVYTGTLDFRPWIDPFPESDEDFARLRTDLEDVATYEGTLISFGSPSRAVAILVEVGRELDREALSRSIRELAQAEGGDGHRVHVVGAPVAESLLGQHLLADLMRLVPIGMAAMVGVFFLFFRRILAALLPLFEIGPAIVVTFAILGWLGIPVYLTLTIIPVILTAVGVADELHVFTAYLRKRREMPDEADPALARATMHSMAPAVVKTSLTTAIGFLSFTLTPVASVRTFGAFMALGVLVCLLWSMSVMPACLALFGRHMASKRAVQGPSVRMEWLGHLVLERRKSALAIVILLAIASPFGILRVNVQDSWVEGFAKESELRTSTARVDELFGGTHLLRIALDTGAVEAEGTVERADFTQDSVLLKEKPASSRLLAQHRIAFNPPNPDGGLAMPPVVAFVERTEAVREGTRVFFEKQRFEEVLPRLPTHEQHFEYRIDAEGRIRRPAILERIGAFERFLASQKHLGVGRVLGPHEHLATMSYMLLLRKEGTRRIPEDALQVRLGTDRYVDVRGERRLRQVFDQDFQRGVITVFLGHSNFDDTAVLLENIGEYAERELTPHGIQLGFAGDVALSQAMIAGTVRTFCFSLVISLLGIWALTSWMTGSRLWGLACVFPPALAIASVFGAMGWLGIPLGVATSMFAATVLGIGVDYAIHVSERARQAMAEGAASEAAIARALGHCAPAITVDALAVGVAFGLLGLSLVPTNARLGGLVVLSLGVCWIATLLGLPSLLQLAAARRR